MSKVNNLLDSAAVIRDATQERENTALRVGGFLVSLVQAIVQSLPPSTIDATAIDTQATDTSFIITMRTMTSDGVIGSKQITIPVASTSTAGLMSRIDRANLTQAINNAMQALSKADQAVTDSGNALTKANTAEATANAAAEDASNAVTDASEALGTANDARDAANSILNRIGMPEGIAPLNNIGKIPASYIPNSYDDVLEFEGMVSGVTAQMMSTSKTPEDEGCAVVFNLDTNRFIIAVNRTGIGIGARDYYNNWVGADDYGDPDLEGKKPTSGRLYVSTQNNVTYRWSGTQLVAVGSDLALGETESTAYPGNKGKQNADNISALQTGMTTLQRALTVAQNAIAQRTVVNINHVRNIVGAIPWTQVKAYLYNNFIVGPGYLVIYLDSDTQKWETKICYASNAAQVMNDHFWDSINGSAVGNLVNVDEIAPSESYYNRGTAASAVPEELRTAGRKITFMSAANTWQTWQFVGALASDWLDDTKWVQEVKSVSFNNSAPITPDANGVINLEYEVDVDQELNAESPNPIANRVVAAQLEEVQQGQVNHLEVSGQQLSLCTADGAISTVTLPAGGGGTTNPTAIEITITSGMKDTIKEGDDYNVTFEWRHYNINTNVDTQYGGRVELVVNGSSVFAQDVVQGVVSLPVGPWLAVGTNSVIVKITADDGLIAQSPRIKPTVVTLSLTSTYDLATVTEKGTPIPFKYVVTGSGDKTVKFKLDGTALPSEQISTSGATSTKSIATSSLTHGAHHLEVWAEREITVGAESVMLESNHLHYDLMVYVQGNNTVVISTEYPPTSGIDQYETIVLPYAVYNPQSTTAEVSISVNGTPYQSAVVDRSRQTVTYRAKAHGSLEFAITVGSVTKTITVNVVPAATQIEAETDALALYLSSSGRTNAATNAADWSFANPDAAAPADRLIRAQFTNCPFDSTSGWIADDKGLVSLHLAKGARCYIPYQPFKTEAKNSGKTIEIEFKVSNCYDFDATLISCLAGGVGFEVKAQECYFSSALNQRVGTKFNQNERLRIGFQVEQVNGNRFMYLYHDGVMCGVIQYDTSDRFIQSNPVGILLGHDACELDIYNIRIYDNCLAPVQMVNNFIADMDDTDLMFEKLERNNVYNADSAESKIDYDKVVQMIPCMTYIGTLPRFKGDKQKGGKIVYEDRLHPEFSFTCPSIQIDVQGTSSQYYPRKNWKIKFLEQILMTLSQQYAKKYALRAVGSDGQPIEQKAVKTFCLKADFAESSGTHNTGAANFINEVLVNAGLLTPPQQVDPTVRTTIYGHPILMFHQADEQSPRVFLGKYNFNNDKSTQDTFGFENIAGYNKGMVNRDDYLVYDGTMAALQADADALAAAEDDGEYLMYLINASADNTYYQHLVEYDTELAAWKDKGEMWRWNATDKCWKNRANESIQPSEVQTRLGQGLLIENETQCWELLNNGHPMCLFKESDFTRRVYGSDLPDWMDEEWLPSDDNGKYGPYWAGAFEPRYPDNDDHNKRFAQGAIPTELKNLLDFVSSCDALRDGLTATEQTDCDRRFRENFERYFNKPMTLAYSVIRFKLLMADQGAKNMMMAYFRGQWWLIFYDNDTILGINNEGRIIFIPYVELHSKDTLDKYVFNGESSVLWNMIERNFASDEATIYDRLATQGKMTYERALYWFNQTQSDMWSESVYNADGKFKYIDSFGVAGEGDGLAQNYLDIAQGSRRAHRTWMLHERFAYCDAKFCTGTYRESFVYLRANTKGASSVPSKVEVNVTAAQDWYFGFRFSGNAGYTSRFLEKGETATFSGPENAQPNDTETYIHQADRISSLGDLSVLYPTTLLVAQCRMLEDLNVGNAAEGYIGKLATLTLGVHPLLHTIQIRNIPTLTQSVNATGCTALQRFYAKGSSISAVNLAVGAPITELELPGTVVQLVFVGLPSLSNAGLDIDSLQGITNITIDRCPQFDAMRLLLEIMDDQPGALNLQTVHITGVALHGTGRELLDLVNRWSSQTGRPFIDGTYQLERLLEQSEITAIEAGIDGINLVIDLMAYIARIDEVNAESYTGSAEVGTVSLDNVDDHILYFNGETYEEYLARVAEDNRSIHDIINE